MCSLICKKVDEVGYYEFLLVTTGYPAVFILSSIYTIKNCEQNSLCFNKIHHDHVSFPKKKEYKQFSVEQAGTHLT